MYYLEIVLLNFSAFRLSHFLSSFVLILAGVVLPSQQGFASITWLHSFFSTLFEVLPVLLLGLGGILCLFYGRTRQAALLVVVYLSHYILANEAEYFRMHGVVRESTALTFHLCSLLLPLLYGIYAAWSERAQLVQDLVARSAVLVAVVGVAVAMARRYPDGVLQWLVAIRVEQLQGPLTQALIQFSYAAFALTFLILLIQYLRHPRVLHASQLVGVLGLYWMLLNTFMLPEALVVMSSMVMLALIVAVAQEAYQMAFLDELTGLPGRRALNERMARLGRNYVIAMTDVDHFKKFNDTYGHDVGDQVLRMVASQLRKVSGGGTAYRYGGEEFTVVYPGKSINECLPHLEALRRNIEEYRMRLRDKQSRPEDAKRGRSQRGQSKGQHVSVAISIGVAERSNEHRDPEDVIKAADQALYKAKEAGRNRVVAYGQKAAPATRRKAGVAR